MWESKEETQAIERSRKYIREVRDLVIVDHAKLNDHCDTFDAHVVKGEATVEKIFHVINNLECPKDATIKVLEDYKKEQNGHLKELAIAAEENKLALTEIKSQTKGVQTEKENRNRRWTLWIGGGAAALVCIGLYFQLSDIRTNQTKERVVMEQKIQHLEEKLNE
jgi:hypothetical protein